MEICICFLLCFHGSVLTWWETDDNCPTSHRHFISRQSKLLQACSFKLTSSGVCRGSREAGDMRTAHCM